MRKILFAICLIMCSCAIVAQSYNNLVDSSFIYIKQQQYNKAESVLQRAMKSDPSNPQNRLLLSNLGTIQRIQGKRKDALHSYDMGIWLSPKSITLRDNRAALLAEMNELDSALIEYGHILKLEPTNIKANYQSALICIERSDTTKANSFVQMLKKIAPYTEETQLSDALLLNLKGSYNKAILILSNLIKKGNASTTTYLARAEAYLASKQLAMADKDIQYVFANDPQEPAVYLLRGKAKLLRFEKEDALLDFEMAKQLGVSQAKIELILNANQ